MLCFLIGWSLISCCLGFPPWAGVLQPGVNHLSLLTQPPSVPEEPAPPPPTKDSKKAGSKGKAGPQVDPQPPVWLDPGPLTLLLSACLSSHTFNQLHLGRRSRLPWGPQGASLCSGAVLHAHTGVKGHCMGSTGFCCMLSTCVQGSLTVCSFLRAPRSPLPRT